MGVEIKKDIFWVGAVDWNVRNFHGHTYATQRGTTYNCYLILDEKVALVDTVYGPFSRQMLEAISEIIPPGKIDYIIANHVETDHSGALTDLIKLCPRAKVLGTAKCREGLWRNYYGNWDFQVVRSGDKLNLGRKNLSFIEAPMLHWPDSMFTYCPEEKLLLPNDAFGQHYATAERFDDQVEQFALMEEAAKYYANILWPLSQLVLQKIEQLEKMGLTIEMIAPSHGIIWRQDPLKIIKSYVSWARNTTQPKAVLVYETMWQATARMSQEIIAGLVSSGIKVKVFDIASAERTEVIKEMLEAKGFLIGSSTHDNGMLPTIAGFLEFLKGLKPKNRIAAAFGSYGWSGGAVRDIEARIKEAGIEIVQPGLGIVYMPDKEQLGSCFQWGRAFAERIKAAKV
jgi:flavorubredoxin